MKQVSKHFSSLNGRKERKSSVDACVVCACSHKTLHGRLRRSRRTDIQRRKAAKGKKKASRHIRVLALSQRFFSLHIHHYYTALRTHKLRQTHRRIHTNTTAAVLTCTLCKRQASKQASRAAYIQSTRLIRHLRFENKFG